MSEQRSAWDEDPLTVRTTDAWAHRFRLWVRILIVPAAVWFAWNLTHYLSRGGWSLNVNDPYYFAPLVISTIALATLLALELLKPLARPDDRHIRKRFGMVSAIASVLCLVGIATSWIMVYGKGSDAGTIGRAVHSQTQADSYLREHGQADYVRIPTGVFIQAVEFKGTSNVGISGYAWQRVPKSLGKDFKPGVVFPEAAESYAAVQDKVYEQDQGDSTLIGWYFNSEFRQLFDYASYPLDKQNVWLRMWANDFNSKVLLTPDFAAYDIPWRPHTLPGMDDQLVYGDWNPDFTAYSYVNHPHSANFGYDHGQGVSEENTPELYFNLGLKRDPQGPLYGQLIRWLFIALIVFAALFLITVDAEQREVVGFTTFEVMSFAVGMLLVIVFDQTAVRDATGARGVVYLEYFSYALYAMILLVCLNAMVLTARVHIRALTWGGNLLPKLLYWPLYLGLVLVATLLAFFC